MTRLTIQENHIASRAMHIAGWVTLAAGVAATAKTGKKRYSIIGAAAGFGLAGLGQLLFEETPGQDVARQTLRLLEEMHIR